MDRILESLRKKRIVFWEEVARDGSQAKTLMTGDQRVNIARLHSQVFNDNGPDHLVFAAGFVSIGNREDEIVRQVAAEVDTCSVVVNCRGIKPDLEKSFELIKKAKYPRVACIIPASERLCRLMLHSTQEEVISKAVDLAKYAVDNSGGIPVDFLFAGAFDADPVFIAKYASLIEEQGVATVGMGDTRGAIFPEETKRFIEIIKQNSSPQTIYTYHFHNDLGFALMNNLECLKQGIMCPATSWLGLGERNGLLRTELLTFLLANESEFLQKRIGIDGEKLFLSKPNLKMLPLIAKKVSKYTRVPLKITDPIVGTGVNSISTGTPFVDIHSFQAFDPFEALGIEQKIYVTHLASKRVIKEVSGRLGYFFEDNIIELILKIVKNRTYERGISIMEQDELIALFKDFEN